MTIFDTGCFMVGLILLFGISAWIADFMEATDERNQQALSGLSVKK